MPTYLETSFVEMSAPFAATGPRSAAHVMLLLQWLRTVLPPEDACVVAAWVGTGKAKAKWWEFGQGSGGAKEHCAKEGYHVSLADGLDSLKHLDEPNIYAAIVNWGQRKQASYEAMVAEQSSEDTQKIVEDAWEAAEEAASEAARLAKEAAQGIASGAKIGAAILVVAVGYLIYQKAK